MQNPKSTLTKTLLVFSSLLFSFSGFQVAHSESIAGKSITLSAKYKFKVCRDGRCKYTDSVTVNWKNYIAKDRKKIYSYTGNGKGEIYVSGARKDGGIFIIRRDGFSGKALGNPESSGTITIKGNKCKFNAFIQWKGRKRINAIFLKPTRCKVSEGNIFR